MECRPDCLGSKGSSLAGEDSDRQHRRTGAKRCHLFRLGGKKLTINCMVNGEKSSLHMSQLAGEGIGKTSSHGYESYGSISLCTERKTSMSCISEN